MKIGIILSSNNPEKVWNTLRFALAALEMDHKVTLFLMGAGVESEFITNNEYDIKGLIAEFLAKSTLLACGSCLQKRNLETQTQSQVVTMIECIDMVAGSDKVVTF